MPIYLKFHKMSQKNYWTYTPFKTENSWATYHPFVSVFKGSINVSERVPEKLYAGANSIYVLWRQTKMVSLLKNKPSPLWICTKGSNKHRYATIFFYSTISFKSTLNNCFKNGIFIYWNPFEILGKKRGKQGNKSQLNSILLSQFLWFQASENYR